MHMKVPIMFMQAMKCVGRPLARGHFNTDFIPQNRRIPQRHRGVSMRPLCGSVAPLWFCGVRRAQSLVEYTVLVGTVVTAFALTQTYLRRAIQARLNDAAREGASVAPQYEPYYVTSTGGKVDAKTSGQYTFSAGGAVTGSATLDVTVKCLDPNLPATCPSQTITPPPP